MEYLVIAEDWIIRIVTALITLFLGIIAAKLISRIVKHVLAEVEINRLMKQSGLTSIDTRVAKIIEISLYAILGIIILQVLGLTRIVLFIVGGVFILGIVTSTILGFRDLIPNMYHGIKVRKLLKEKVGRKIKIGNVQGTLVKRGLLQVVIESGEQHYIPNAYAAKKYIRH